MSTFDKLAGFADSVTNAKQVSVSTATDQKQAEQGVIPSPISQDNAYQLQAGRVGNIGTGAFEQGSIASDFTNLSPLELISKYGIDQGTQLINQRANAADEVYRDKTMQRTPARAVTDTATGLATGLVNSLGGIAALGTGLVNDNAGAWVSKQLGDLGDWAHSTESDALNARRKVVASQGQLTELANENQYKQDIKDGTNPIVASLSRIGRDALDSVSNVMQDSTALGDGLAEGVGSLFAAAPVIKGVTALGKLATANRSVQGARVAAAIDAASDTNSLARIGVAALDKAGAIAPGAIGIGAMEAGGAYQQLTSEIMKMSHKELLEKSPTYQQHIKDGLSPDEARRQTASEAGLDAAAIQFPVAAATGPLVARFEASPLRVGSLGAAASNVGRETLEEAIQGGTGQLAQNISSKRNIDKNTDITKGIGEQAGLGALYGFGAAALVQAPGAAGKAAGAALAPAIRTTMAGLRAAGDLGATVTKPARDALVARGERVLAQNERASPVADETVQAAAQEATAQAANAEDTLYNAVNETESTPEQKEAAYRYASDLVNATRFDANEYSTAPDSIQAAVANSTNRVEAIQKLADLVNSTEETNPEALMTAASYLYDGVMGFEEFVNRDPAALSNLPKDSPANAVLDQYSGLIANIQNTPKVSRAFRAINRMVTEAAEQGKLEVTENATQQQMENVALAAQVAPEKLSPESVDMVLKHASEGRIQLNNRQRAALTSAAALLKGAREFDSEASRLGLRPQDIVGKQIKTDESRTEEGQYSALQHAQRIRSAYNSGNLDLAGAYLNDFMQFAQHMQNKVGALNEHLVSGNADKNKSVHYQALTPSRDWIRSRTGLGINPYDTKSVKFAQQVGLEAKTVGDIANALASAYPELKVPHIEVTSLDSRLNDNAAQVVKAFRQSNRDAASSQQTAEPVNQVSETPVVNQEAKPTVAEPVEDNTTTTKQTTETVEEVTKTEPQKAKAAVTENVENTTQNNKSGTAAVYPNLYSSEKVSNYFVNSYNVPAEPKTRTIGTESPIADVTKALSSRARYEVFTNQEEANPALTADVTSRYAELMEHGNGIADILRNRMEKFLNTKNVGKRFAEGTEANRWVGGKLLNIVEQDGNSFKYNEELLQSAVLAGLQWRLTAVQNSAVKDAKDVAAITGIEESLLPDGMVDTFENGMTLVEATNSLAQKIESYWGMDRNPTAPLGYTKGIPAAMAAEMLGAFVESGDVTETILNMSDIDPDNKKTVGLYSIAKLDEADPINKFPTAIEEAVLIQPEEKMYFGDDIPSVARNQLRNPAVENTPEQRKALKAEQQTEFFVHEPMVNFYETFGRDNILELLGAGSVNSELLNDNTAKSMEGKNLSVAASYDHLFNVINQVRAQTDNIAELPIHYGYNMTRVGRMQMLGKYNPQSAKLVREAILPTKATLDLSSQNSADFSAFQLGLAQALGIKVHNMSRDVMAQKLTDALNGKMKPAVDMMADFDRTGSLPDNSVEILNDALGNDKSFVALMALMEYARYQNSDNKATFNTPLYVEADGVTNGPINAMVLMTGGKFSPTWINNVAKGGLFFGKPDMSMNTYRSTLDNVDLYEASTNALKASLTNLRNTYAGNPAINAQMNHLTSLMDLFVPDLTLREDGALELKRGIAKNPLTITIYGSGARGIAGKMVSTITDAVYQRMSDVLQARAVNPDISAAMAMFGKEASSEAHAEQLLARFVDNMKALTSTIPVSRKGKLELNSSGTTIQGKIDPKKYTIKGDQLKALQENMLHFFVEPMREGIKQTVGGELMHTTEQLQKATQIQSIVLEDLFKQRVQAKLLEKEKDPTWKKGDFLTQKELNDIQASLSNLAPMIETGSQTFYIAGSENTEVANQVLATNLDDRMRIPMSIYAPSQAGVAGIPFMTIGTGDGMMMQTLSTMKGAPKNTLKIFDGMNIGLNDIQSASLKANEAVYTSWQGNPIKNVYDSYTKFMKNVDFSELSPEALEAVKSSALEYAEREGASLDYIKSGAELIERNLRNIALAVDIKHKVMNQVQTTVDQMAAVGAPYNNNGKIDLSNMTVDQQVNELNRLFDAEIASRVKVKEPVKTKVPASFDTVGRAHSTGVRILSNTSISQLSKAMNMSSEQSAVLNEIQKSLAAKNYKVIYGDPSQLSAYAQAKNLSELTSQEMEAAQDGDIHGWTNFDDQTIFLVSPSMETLTHELVHAASFEKVLAHYNNENTDPSVKEAVNNIEQLMNQFRSLDMSGESAAMQESYADAMYTIDGHLNNGFVEPGLAKAAAVNEFMAWGLTNRNLALKQKVTPSLVRIAKDIYAAIKKLIWGRKAAPKVADDMFSNLLFNSAVVMRSQPTTQAVVTDSTLFHSNAYGNSERLTNLNKTFDNLVTNYLNVSPVDQVTRTGKVQDALMMATTMTRSVQAHGFPMTMQEQSVFQMVVAALATEANIDTLALSRAQELYAHVSKNLKVEDFMADPNSTNPADRYYAQEKFNTILGNNVSATDKLGRSTLLPVFMGLAMVNDEFRSVLQNMPVPRADRKLNNTLDNILTNAGTQAMEALNTRLAGDSKSQNVQESIDALTNRIMEASLNRESFYDSVANPAGSMIDRANQYVIDGVERLSDETLTRARTVAATTNNPLVKATTHAAQLVAAVATEKNGEIVSRGVMAAMNQGKVWQPFHDLVNDIVGRTKTNANVYDMIKAVRAQVQADRQQFRENLPTIIAEKFTRELSKEEWGAMHTGIGKTDLAVLRETMSNAEIRDLLSDSKIVDTQINNLEASLSAQAGRNWGLIERKSKQLARYMITGEVGNNLLRNATAISRLLGERTATKSTVDIAALDKLITLYSLETMNKADRDVLSSLAQSETEGMDFSLSYVVGQRVEEMRKAKADIRSSLNSYKGHIPVQQQQGVNLIVAEDSQFANLSEQSYTRISNYTGSSGDTNRTSRGYYFSPVSARAPFSQGILQNVRDTANGVDVGTGFTMNTMVAGRITDKPSIQRIQKALARGERGNEPLMPIYDEKGFVVAYERSIDPSMLKHLNQDNHFAKMIGVWRGRQVEEAKAQSYNNTLMERLYDMYSADMKEASSNKSQYVNLLGKVADPVLADAVKLMNAETKQKAESLFGNGELWVRRDMLNDAMGYRSASVGDAWTGNSRWSDETRDTVKKMFVGAFGNDAYRYLMSAENTIQNVVKDAKTLIVVKSMVVPAVNFLANVYQLIGRGVPVKDIAQKMPRKTSEINQYLKSRIRQVEAEAELRASTNPNQSRKLEAEIQSITDSHKRMSIWPLLERGEFSSIADSGIGRDEILLSDGKVQQYLDQLANRLPPAIRAAGRYALITKDTALFQGVQKTVEYSDFIAKAIIYDDLVNRKKLSKEDALGRVTEEFINYDRLPGRFRGYMESMGLMWFYNFKIRSSKIAVSMIRNNPVHAAIATIAPAPTMFGNVGLPMQDNMFTMMAEGRLDYSLGFGQGLRAPNLNPWTNLVN